MRFILLLSFFVTPAFAQNDVCCIMASVDGNNVKTFADYKTDLECKSGVKTTTYTGQKTICKALAPDDANCSDRGPQAQEKRCNLCGYTWVSNACVTKDLEAENERLKEEKEKLKEKVNTKDSSGKGATTQSNTGTQLLVD